MLRHSHIIAFLSYRETAVHTGITAAGSQQGALETQQNSVTKDRLTFSQELD